MKLTSEATRLIALPNLQQEMQARKDNFPLISIQEVSAKYSIPMRTLRRWQALGKMPEQVPHGRWKKYRKSEVEISIKQNRR